MRSFIALVGVFGATVASAGPCDAAVARGAAARGADVAPAFQAVLACDRAQAEAGFGAMVRNAGDVESLLPLSLAAIDAEMYGPVWEIAEVIRDYGQKNTLARGIGSACADHPNVAPFVQGAYFGLRGPAFTTWAKALETCESAALREFVATTAGRPPAVPYDEKYAAVVDAYVADQGAAAIDTLKAAAVAAAGTGGPYDALLGALESAARPRGGAASPEDRARLVAALAAIGAEVGPDRVGPLADRLLALDAHTEAGALVPRAWPDRRRADGTFLYGVAAVEACDGAAVVHVAAVTDPGKRWSLTDDAGAAIRAARPRLRCAAPTPWPVTLTTGPIADEAALETWFEGQVSAASAGGTIDAKRRDEAPVALP
jgi:hypothetical protein